MKNLCKLALTLLLAAPTWSEAVVGDKAPEFSTTSTQGKSVKLSDYAGKYVVLEWFNHKCPFVKAQYDPGKMQSLQKKWTGQGVVWISICSSAEGKQGYLTSAEANQVTQEKGAASSAVVLDPKGELGHLYGAKTTPHMFVIDPQGKVIYSGAIDDKAQVNYVEAALSESKAGKPISHGQTQPYGCGVKY